jgi:geranylgeranyl transferase type-1 subunit beta
MGSVFSCNFQGFFALSGLDLLDKMDVARLRRVAPWVYSLLSPPIAAAADAIPCAAFEGGTSTGRCFPPPLKQDAAKAAGSEAPVHPYTAPHIAMTFAALAMLVIAGDDLSRVDRPMMASFLRHLQNPDGRCVPSFPHPA